MSAIAEMKAAVTSMEAERAKSYRRHYALLIASHEAFARAYDLLAKAEAEYPGDDSDGLHARCAALYRARAVTEQEQANKLRIVVAAVKPC